MIYGVKRLKRGCSLTTLRSCHVAPCGVLFGRLGLPYFVRDITCIVMISLTILRLLDGFLLVFQFSNCRLASFNSPFNLAITHTIPTSFLCLLCLLSHSSFLSSPTCFPPSCYRYTSSFCIPCQHHLQFRAESHVLTLKMIRYF